MSAATAARWSLTSRPRCLRSTVNVPAAARMQRSDGSTNSAPVTATCSMSGRAGRREYHRGRLGETGKTEASAREAETLPFRQPFKRRNSLGDLMEWLLVDGVDRRLRGTEQLGLVQGSDFQNHSR